MGREGQCQGVKFDTDLVSRDNNQEDAQFLLHFHALRSTGGNVQYSNLLIIGRPGVDLAHNSPKIIIKLVRL